MYAVGHRKRRSWALQIKFVCLFPCTMSELILPGEQVPAKHVNLKLGPGLTQLSNVGQEGSVISIKAGELKHSANNSRWWIESNSRRV